MFSTKRLAILLLTGLIGTAACSDATGPRPDTPPCTEQQGTGGRC